LTYSNWTHNDILPAYSNVADLIQQYNLVDVENKIKALRSEHEATVLLNDVEHTINVLSDLEKIHAEQYAQEINPIIQTLRTQAMEIIRRRDNYVHGDLTQMKEEFEQSIADIMNDTDLQNMDIEALVAEKTREAIVQQKYEILQSAYTNQEMEVINVFLDRLMNVLEKVNLRQVDIEDEIGNGFSFQELATKTILPSRMILEKIAEICMTNFGWLISGEAD